MALAGLGLTACSDDPQVPQTAAATTAAVFTGRVNAVLQQPPSVRVTDGKGKSIKGLLVRWRVTSGGGRVSSDSSRTDGSGVASSGGWVLGTTAGTQTLEAQVDGLAPTVFTATAAPGAVTRVMLLSADNQIAPVNSTVAAAPSVRVEDQFGNAITGLPVTFAVVQGNGSVDGASQTTNASGVATAQSWMLGTLAGLQRVRATATDQLNGASASVEVSAVALPGAAVGLSKIAGDNQVGTFGLPAPIAPGVRVVDVFGNGVGNIPVVFTPGPNSGTVSNAQQSSDPANGSAFVGAWTLGGSSTTQTLVATSPSLPGASVTFTATANSSQFDIEVRFIGAVANPAVRQAFLTAAAKWKTVIVGDLQRSLVNIPAGACEDPAETNPWTPAVNEVINDLVIYARIAPIDSAGDEDGNILGQAYPCMINSGTLLTALGIMEFDDYDMNQLVADGSLTDVVTHEIGHVLGFGTLWDYSTRTLLVGRGGSDPYFQGAAGRSQFQALNSLLYSGIAIPVENSGGAGTRDSHWRESVLRNELMTGFLNRGSNPLSRISAASLQDMGYAVNVGAADGYAFTAALYQFPGSSGSSRKLHADVKRMPLFSVDSRGRVTKVRN